MIDRKQREYRMRRAMQMIVAEKVHVTIPSVPCIGQVYMVGSPGPFYHSTNSWPWDVGKLSKNRLK